MENIRWQNMHDAPDLCPGALHLWRIRTGDDGADPACCFALLGERQQARARKMRLDAARARYLRAQAGLRLILARYLRTSPQTIDFDYGPAGKPSLCGTLHILSFNLSTSGDLALVGLSAGSGPESELGVDCEWIRPGVDHQAIAARMFEPDLVRELAAIPEPERLTAFYRAWTALEADAKADGRGLFRPRPPGTCRPMIAHCIPEAGHVAAVARAELPPVSDWLTFDLDWFDLT